MSEFRFSLFFTSCIKNGGDNMLASFGERKIHEILESNGIVFQEEYTIDGLCSENGTPLRLSI